jgi:SAM-dependent methyltransferase
MQIKYLDPFTKKELAEEDLRLFNSESSFPFVKGAFRIAGEGNYAESFGFQWNKFAKTQVDRFQKTSRQSQERFFKVTCWNEIDLTGQNVLEVGSGAGRFSQIVLQYTNANLFSVDYSNAVEANFANNGPHPRLKLFQASIYELPFFPQQFDKVFCFGVLQHTPDFKKSISCLVDMVRPGGELVIDFYPVKGWYTKIHSKYILRPITRKMSPQKLLSLIDRNIDVMISAYQFFDKLRVGKIVNRFLPICDIKNTLPAQLSPAELREWAILDTFDMLSPTHDHPQRLNKVVGWFNDLGVKNVKGTVVSYGENSKVTVVKVIR